MTDTWQSIETAPKDGTEILVYCEAGQAFVDEPRQMAVARWQISETPYFEEVSFGLYRKATTTLKYWIAADYYRVEPTHWMPLPGPPILL